MCGGNRITVSKVPVKVLERTRCPCSREAEEDLSVAAGIHPDALAVSTKVVARTLLVCTNIIQNFQQSKWSKILFGTAQPAHLITLLAVSSIACLMYPSDASTTNQNELSPLLNLIYLGSVSAHFGAQLWMSFVSGLSLYFSLPRHTFGRVQRILFPKYFLVNSILSMISLSIFSLNNSSRLASPQVAVQNVTLITCFLIELVIRLYLTPPLLQLMEQKNVYEEATGSGMEVGKHDAGVLTNNTHYLKVYKSFRNVHMMIATGNIITMGCSVLHLHYLSSRLNSI